MWITVILNGLPSKRTRAFCHFYIALKYNNSCWLWGLLHWSRIKANRVLPREHIGHNKHPVPKTQEPKKWLYTRTLPNGEYWNHTDYVLFSQRWRSSIQLAKTRPGADWGKDRQLLIAKLRLKLKKVCFFRQKEGGNHKAIQVWPKSNPLWLYNGSSKSNQGTRSDRQSA